MKFTNFQFVVEIPQHVMFVNHTSPLLLVEFVLQVLLPGTVFQGQKLTRDFVYFFLLPL